MENNILKTRWLYLLLFCVVNLFTGLLYCWSVLSLPLAEHLSQAVGEPVKVQDLALAFSFASFINPVGMIIGGYFCDRFGPKIVLVPSGLIVALGLALTSIATSVAQVNIFFGLIFGFGVGLTYTSTIGSVLKYFPDRAGFAGGLASMAYGCCAIILPPIANLLIQNFGTSMSLRILAICSGSVIVIGGLLSQKCPSGIAIALKKVLSNKKTKLSCAGPDKDWKQMLATPAFWPMLFLYISGCTAPLMMFSSASSIAQMQAGFTPAAAALCVSAIAFANTVARFIAGSASDKFGRLPSLACAQILSFVGLVCLMAATQENQSFFVAGLILLGICYGSFVGIYPGFTVDQFGSKHNSVNYGIMAAGFSLGGVLGPVILTVTADGSNFSLAYISATSVGLVGAVCWLVCIRLLSKNKKEFNRRTAT